MRLLIQGGTVLTMGRSNLERGDVLVEGGRITEVGPGLRARGADVVDASDAIVMPGFVDAHQHVSDTLFRHAGIAAARAERSLSPDDLHAATLAGLLAAVDAGTTTVADWAAPATTPDHADAVLTAHEESGIRSVVALPMGSDAMRPVLDHVMAGPRPERTTAAIGIDEASRADHPAWAEARRRGLGIHLHALPRPGDAAALGAAGVLSSDTVLADCAHLDEPDLDAVAGSGAAVAVTAAWQMTAALGVPPIQGMIDRGMRPGLGVGSVAETPGDLFAQMRTVISIQHATVFDRKLLGKAGLPRLMTTREIIRHATVDGAGAIGLGSITGAIEPGMQADLVVLATDRPNIHPINDPIGAVVWGMDTSNVDTVVVAGRPLKRSGALVADVGPIRDAAAGARARVGATSGVRR